MSVLPSFIITTSYFEYICEKNDLTLSIIVCSSLKAGAIIETPVLSSVKVNTFSFNSFFSLKCFIVAFTDKYNNMEYIDKYNKEYNPKNISILFNMLFNTFMISMDYLYEQ